MPLRVRSYHEPEAPSTAEFKPWFEAELYTIINNFPDPKKNQTKFTEKFKILNSTSETNTTLHVN